MELSVHKVYSYISKFCLRSTQTISNFHPKLNQKCLIGILADEVQRIMSKPDGQLAAGERQTVIFYDIQLTSSAKLLQYAPLPSTKHCYTLLTVNTSDTFDNRQYINSKTHQCAGWTLTKSRPTGVKANIKWT